MVYVGCYGLLGCERSKAVVLVLAEQSLSAADGADRFTPLFPAPRLSRERNASVPEDQL